MYARMYVPAHVEARGQCSMLSPCELLPYLLRQSLSADLSFTMLCWLAISSRGSHSFLQCWDYKCVLPPPASHMGSEAHTHGLTHAQ